MMLVINFEYVNARFTEGTWTKEQCACAVVKKKITAEDYKTITGDDYIAPTV